MWYEILCYSKLLSTIQHIVSSQKIQGYSEQSAFYCNLNHSLCLEDVLGLGYECEGRKMVNAVVDATPDDCNLVVVMDWSGGFWDRMLEEYPQIVVF